MPQLSVVMIVKNEAAHLAECLATVAFADECIVLDSGSQDETVAIAQAAGAQVSVNADWQGYGVQRQRAQALAKGDWILVIDADERVTPQLAAEIQQIVAQNQLHQVYRLRRLSYCFGRFIRHGGWYPDDVVRLYPRQLAGYGHQLVHESVEVPDGTSIHTLTADLLHYTYPDVYHYLDKSARYAKAWSEQKYQQGKRARLSQAFLHGLACFLKMYILKAGFLDGRAGGLLAVLSGHSTFAKYADLWWRERNQGLKNADEY